MRPAVAVRDRVAVPWFVIVLLAAALAAVTTVTPSTRAEAATGSFRFAQSNLLYSMTDARFLADLDKVAARSDVMSLNEVAGRRALLASWGRTKGWHVVQPGTGSAHAGEVAILARKSLFTYRERGSQFVCDTNPDAPPPPRYNTWAHFEHIGTGMELYVIGAHANASIDDGGHPEPLPRTACAEKQFRSLRDLADAKRDLGQVIVAGDLNVDFVADKRVQYANFPYVVLDERADPDKLPGLRSNYAIHGVKGTGTHGNRHIDYVYLWKRLPQYRVLFMTDYSIFTDLNSDHHAVIARFTIRL